MAMSLTLSWFCNEKPLCSLLDPVESSGSSEKVGSVATDHLLGYCLLVFMFFLQ